ncbi:hypothetical protein [Streptomyces mirabilis]|uniref:hypothetical protein n=1 Tax=Streptomyces mirabilis TaxID=68239 RepID=UPI00332896C0
MAAAIKDRNHIMWGPGNSVTYWVIVMDSETRIYESRFGWTGKTILLALISLAFVAASFMVPLWVAVLGGTFFGICFLLITWSASSRKVALRIDPQGITLGGSPLPLSYGYKKDVIPWRDVISIVLWDQYIPPYSWMPYFGVQRRAGSPVLSGASSSRWPTFNNKLIPWDVTT